MSLKKTKIVTGDIELIDAYHRVTSIKQILNVTGELLIEIVVSTFKDEESKKKDSVVESRVFYVTKDTKGADSFFSEDVLKLEGNSILKNTYEYLKTTDMFSDSVDV